MNRMFFYLPAFMLVFILLFFSCRPKADEVSAAESTETVTPVTAIRASVGSMQEFVDLNATSVFRQKWIVKSNMTGYLQKLNVQLNDQVSSGQALFIIKSKEAQSIGNTINILDSSFRFSGVNTIRSNGNGFISELNRQQGGYVQDGEQLAVITDINSFVFLLDLPYEMRSYLYNNNPIVLELPDGEKLPAVAGTGIPSMDSSAQTQKIVLKVKTIHPLPENLIAKVRLITLQHDHAVRLPRSAILSDETQSIFWVMKLLNDSIAVKTEISKGIESGDSIEILSPVFGADDKIVVSGNFGLPDTAKVALKKN